MPNDKISKLGDYAVLAVCLLTMVLWTLGIIS